MTLKLTRRAFMMGTATAATLAAMPRAAYAADLAFKGELAVTGIVRTPPDEAWVNLMKTFGEANPGITVVETAYPSNTFVTLFTAQQTAGQPVDVLSLNGQDLRRYALNGTLEPLDNVGLDLGRFRKSALATGQVNGVTYGLPTGHISGFPVWINRKVLERVGVTDAPQTYADLIALRDKLAPLGLKVFTHPGRRIFLWPVWFFTVFAQTSGNKSNERTAEILSGKAKFTDEDVVKALQIVFQFGADGLIPQDVFSRELPETVADFSAGNAAFWLHHQGIIAQMANDKPPAVELDVMLMPKLVDGDVKSQYPGGPSSVIGLPVNKDADRRAAGLAFLDWVTTDEADAALVAFNKGTVPVNAGLATASGGISEKLSEFSANIVTYLDWNWPPEVTAAFQEGIQAGVAGQSSAEDVAAEAQRVLDQLISNGYVFQQ